MQTSEIEKIVERFQAINQDQHLGILLAIVKIPHDYIGHFIKIGRNMRKTLVKIDFNLKDYHVNPQELRYARSIQGKVIYYLKILSTTVQKEEHYHYDYNHHLNRNKIKSIVKAFKATVKKRMIENADITELTESEHYYFGYASTLEFILDGGCDYVLDKNFQYVATMSFEKPMFNEMILDECHQAKLIYEVDYIYVPQETLSYYRVGFENGNIEKLLDRTHPQKFDRTAFMAEINDNITEEELRYLLKKYGMNDEEINIFIQELWNLEYQHIYPLNHLLNDVLIE